MPSLGSQTGYLTELLDRIDNLVESFRMAGDKTALTLALTLLGDAHWGTNITSMARSAWEEALGAGEGKPRYEGALRFRLASAMAMGPLPVSAALRKCDELDEEAGGRLALQAGPLDARGQLEAMRGNFDDARTLASAFFEIATDFGLTLDAAAARGQRLGTIESLAGDFVAAERYRRESCEMLEQMGDRGLLSTSEALLAHTLCSLSRWEEAIEASNLAEEHGDPDDLVTQHLWRSARAKAYARLARNAEAIDLARAAWALVETADVIELKVGALMDLSEVLDLSGEAEEATARLQDALEMARHKEHKVYEEAILSRLAQWPGLDK